jgi:hypothetical protein
MLDQGEAPAAVADLITVLLSRSGDTDDEAYRAVLHDQVAITNRGTVHQSSPQT